MGWIERHTASPSSSSNEARVCSSCWKALAVWSSSPRRGVPYLPVRRARHMSQRESQCASPHSNSNTGNNNDGDDGNINNTNNQKQ